MNRHWELFAGELGWFLTDKRVSVGALASTGAWRPSRKLANILPSLSRLLSNAYTSQVAIDDRQYLLFSWEGTTGVSSWLSPPPCPKPSGALYQQHRELLLEFGGITERANHPDDSWLFNTTESLTQEEGRHDASFMSGYSAFDEIPGGIPIVVAEYYSISQEANGNTTICHRDSGEVLLFAADHSFSDVVPMEGCPLFAIPSERCGHFSELGGDDRDAVGECTVMLRCPQLSWSLSITRAALRPGPCMRLEGRSEWSVHQVPREVRHDGEPSSEDHLQCLRPSEAGGVECFTILITHIAAIPHHHPGKVR